jgi:hypothetical protein
MLQIMHKVYILDEQENSCSQLLLHHIPKKTSRSKIQRLHINIITIPAIHKILAVTKGFTKNISQHLQPLKKLRYLKEQQGRKP